MPRLFVSTAEASAELHASRLVAALREQYPDLEVDAAGGAALAGVGSNLVVDMSGRAVMGLWAALAHLRFYHHATERILATLTSGAYDALVVVDAPSFHLRLAKKVHARLPDLPIIYYIAPKLWAWKKWRVKNLRRDIRKTLCIFPFEEAFLRKQGVDAVYAGNPTLDQVRDLDGEAMAARFGVRGATRHSEPERGLLAVFPGSRGSEVKYLWPVMAETIRRIRRRFPELKAAVALAPGWTREKLLRHAPAPDDVLFVENDSQALLAASSVVLAKSGTTTLEAALMGKPMVVCWAADAVSFHIAKFVVTRGAGLYRVSLPNILAQKDIVRELLQGDASPDNLTAELERMLADREYYRKMRGELLALRETLGSERAARQAANEVAASFQQR